MDDRFYTEAELAAFAEQKRENNRIAAEISRARGVTLHPRMAALKRQVTTTRSSA